VKVLAKKKGIPEDEAKLLLESIKESDDYGEIKESLVAIADMGEVVGRLPNGIQPLAVPLIGQAMWSGGSSKAEKIAENVALISAAIRAAYGTDDGAAKLIEDLRKEIQELKEEKLRKEQEEMLSAFKDSLDNVTDYIRALENQIAQIREEKHAKDDLDALDEYLEKAKRTKEKLKALGLIKEKEEDEIDLSKAEELLRRAGYKVERPLTWDSLQKYVEEQMKRVREEAKKEAMEELKIQEKREALLVDLFSTLSGAVLDALKTQGAKGASTTVSEQIAERVKEWKEMKELELEE